MAWNQEPSERLISSSSLGVLAATLLLSVTILSGLLPTFRILSFDVFRIYLYVFVGLALAGYIFSKNPRVPLLRPLILLLLLAALSVASVGWTIQFEGALVGVFTVLVETIFILSMLYLTTQKEQIEFLTGILLLIGWITMVIAFWEIITGHHLEASRLALPKRSDEFGATSVFFNRNDYGMFLSMLSPIPVYYVVCGSRPVTRLVGSLSVGSILIVLWLNGSRAAMLGVGLGAIVILVGLGWRSFAPPVERIPRFGTIGYSVAALLSLGVPALFSNPFSASGQASLFLRYQLLELGRTAIIERPWGYGVDTFQEVAARSTIDTAGILAPHNWAIHLGVELGIPGLLLFILAIGLLTDRLFAHYLIEGESLALPLGASLMAFIPAGLGPSLAIDLYVFWVMVALGLAYLAATCSAQSAGEM